MKTKIIKLITAYYNKVGTKWVEQGIEINNITEVEYNNFIDSKGFFTKIGAFEKHKKNYTCEGYIVTEIHTISPDRKEKIVREFVF
jgi:hypothetical protein